MGVHYERGAVGEIKSMGLVPVTLDISAALTFQGGVSKKRQSQLIRLLTELQQEWDDEREKQDTRETPSLPLTTEPQPKPSESKPAETLNGKPPAVPHPKGATDVKPSPAGPRK